MNPLHWIWIVPASLVGALLLLLMFSARVQILYVQKKMEIWVGLGPGNVQVYPREKQKKRKKHTSPKDIVQEKAEALDGDSSVTPQKLLQYLKLGAEAVQGILQHLRIPELKLHLTVGDSDAAKTAILYGAVSAVTGAVIPPLEEACHIRQLDVAVQADFQGNQRAELDMTISATVGLLLLSAYKVYRRFKRQMQIENKQAEKKGGSENEQSQ